MPRELIDTGTDKRYVRRDKKGQFKESRRHWAKPCCRPTAKGEDDIEKG